MVHLKTITQQQCSTVDEALRVLSDLVNQQDGGDSAYLNGQSERYVYTIRRITQVFPRRCRVLDIGSHYLHQAALLRLLGYEVYGIDVPLFAEAPFVAERAKILDIPNCSVTALEDGSFLTGHENHFDLALFTETLEHITFNPIRFWRRVYELLSENGAIYLTTLNSLRLAALWRAATRLATFRGIGLPVKDIFANVTYGHHWKEYSAREIKQYFETLSPDFDVEIGLHSYLPNNPLRKAISQCLGIFPIFRSDIEAVVRLSGKTGFTAKVPELPMMQKRRQDSSLE